METDSPKCAAERTSEPVSFCVSLHSPPAYVSIRTDPLFPSSPDTPSAIVFPSMESEAPYESPNVGLSAPCKRTRLQSGQSCAQTARTATATKTSPNLEHVR